MKLYTLCCATAASLLSASHTSAYAPPPTPPPSKHQITSLPGWTDLGHKLPSAMYTGFIDAGVPPSGNGTMYFHYWMAESEGNPATDPVVIWYNGGPGASSLFGFFQELGPLLLNENSYDGNYSKSGIPTLQRNEFAWTKAATVIAIDSPPPIGFSYCTEQGPSANGTSCGPWLDSTVFKANHAAHRTLFTELFPTFKKNPFYIAGESYAGIYVPGFVEQMLDDPIEGLNFKGFLVGDGMTGCEPVKGKPSNYCFDLDNVGLLQYPNSNYGPFYDIEFFHGHSEISEELYRTIKATCPDSMLRTPDLSAECTALMKQASDQIGGYFAYNLYNQCPPGELATKYGMNKALQHRRKIQRLMVGDVGGSPCPGNSLTDYLGNPKVLESVGLPADSNFLNLDNGHGFNYTSDSPSVLPIYGKALAKGLRALVYEGTTDACGLQAAPIEDIFVTYFKSIGLKRTRDWRPWTVDGAWHMGGHVMEYNNRQAQFATVRGAGHLVPLNRPQVALAMLQAFFNDTAFPEYKPQGAIKL